MADMLYEADSRKLIFLEISLESEGLVVGTRLLKATRVLFLGWLTFLSPFPVYHGTAQVYDKTLQENEIPPLQLTVTLKDRKYCVGDSELDCLEINARFTFANIGKRRLILYRGSDSISHIAISRNLDSLSARQFEVDASVTEISDGRQIEATRSAPGAAFVTLSPGSSLEVETVISVFAVRGDIGEISGAVLSGEHVLQVRVVTWPDSKKLAVELRNRWSRVGQLWYEPITSVAVPFTVEKHLEVLDCN